MKTLIITNLFPNSQEPTRGIYNLQQFKAFLASGVETKIVAPVPWHDFSALPAYERIEGFDVYHPRYFMIPKIGRAFYGILFFISLCMQVRRIDARFRSDVILSTWAYPDGVGSYLIAKALNKPIVIKVHGSDVNLYSKHFLRRQQIVSALSRADKVIAVSMALKERLIEIGVPAANIAVISNGVDAELFQPMERKECRKELDLPLDRKVVLFVGNFAPVKGVDILVDAFGELMRLRSDAILVLVGDGPLEAMLRDKVKVLGISQKVVFAGRVTHDMIPVYMNSADVFTLPSRNEGCPNVILESFACGTPVVASRVGGVPELFTSGSLGMLVEPDDQSDLVSKLCNALDVAWDKDSTPAQTPLSCWQASGELLKAELDRAVGTKKDKISWKGRVKACLSSIMPKRVLLIRGRKHGKKIAITFDDGPNPQHTPRILDTLKQEGAKATFFVVGNVIRGNEDIVARINREGHSLGSHSWDHRDYDKLSFRQKQMDMKQIRQALEPLSVEPRLFRPPHGYGSFIFLLSCALKKITTVLWSYDSLDYMEKDPETLIANINNAHIDSGDVLLFHDDSETTAGALPEIIKTLKSRGFRLVTVDELVGSIC